MAQFRPTLALDNPDRLAAATAFEEAAFEEFMEIYQRRIEARVWRAVGALLDEMEMEYPF